MAKKRNSAKRVTIAKQAATYGLRVSRKGPFKARSFRVEEAVLSAFLKEVERKGLKLQDAVSDALELWTSYQQ